MAGTINLALSQQFDMDGEPLSGGLLYFFVAGTTNPANSFQDLGLTIVNPNPLVLDASGRVPMFYLADGFIKIRLADKNGVTVIAADQLLVIGPSSGGGGGGGGVDVTTVLATGDIKARYGTGPLDGFVPCNGRSIGQTGSSATELAGPKAQALYEYLWAFPNIAIDGGSKGANANADFLLLKPLLLPDLRGRVIAGLDDMGAAAANRLTSTYFGASGILLGSVGGLESNTLAAAQLPAHLHPLASNVQFGGALTIGTEVDGVGNGQDHSHGWGSSGQFSGGLDGVNGRFGTSAVRGTNLDHAHGIPAGNSPFTGAGPNGLVAHGVAATNPEATSGSGSLDHTHHVDIGGQTGGRNIGHFHAISGSTQNSTGGGAAHANVQPTMVLTIYIKL